METYKRISLALVFLLLSCQSNKLPENGDTNKNNKIKDSIPLEIDNNKSNSSVPRSIDISMKIYDVKDLKVKAGDRVKAAQVIGDRSLERQKLIYQKSRLQTELSRLSTDSLYVPILPIAELPESNYDVEQSNINMAQKNLDDAKLAAENQIQKISKLRSIKSGSIEEIETITQHEESVLYNLQTKIKSAEIKLSIAKSRLSKAKQDRKYREYLHQLELYKRSVNLSRQKLELARQEEKVNYQKSQINSQIEQIDNQISQLTEVRSPYDGTIKKIKWAGQSDNVINVVVTLAVESDRSTTSLSR